MKQNAVLTTLGAVNIDSHMDEASQGPRDGTTYFWHPDFGFADAVMYFASFIQIGELAVKLAKYCANIISKTLFTLNAMGIVNPEVSARGGF